MQVEPASAGSGVSEALAGYDLLRVGAETGPAGEAAGPIRWWERDGLGLGGSTNAFGPNDEQNAEADREHEQ